MENTSDTNETIIEPKVDTNIPLAPHPRRTRYKWPLKTMHVGHSFFVPNLKAIQNLRAQIHVFQKASGRRFATRSEPRGGWRVWRTA